jgi:Dyp-type peroxidase family
MLDFSDIQGNILRGYRSFPVARFLFFAVTHAAAGRAFLEGLLPHVTPAKWVKRPAATTNIGLSFAGLRAFDLQYECLASFPSEFQAGMKARAASLGDIGESAANYWDQPWRNENVHILITCYAVDQTALNQQCNDIKRLAPAGVRELSPPQEAALLIIDGAYTRKEHFGFEDGVSNPDVEGVADDGEGGDTGNPDAHGIFRKVPVGEFLLGHRSEGGEIPPMPVPNLLTFNGSFLVFRKLEQNVPRFRQFRRSKAAALERALGHTLPAGLKVEEYLAAKMLGRWYNGSSLDLHPDKPGGKPSNKFTYADDPDGSRCPLGAHTRRVNGRASLGFGGDILRRRRLIRRGIAYGDYLPPDESGQANADASRGIMFLAFNSSIVRQFEFVQQQWVNGGDEFSQGDDSDPIAGARYGDGRMVVPEDPQKRDAQIAGRMMIQGDERTGRSPFLCDEIPRFVTTKGGDYFFFPSITGLRLMALGEVVVS